MTLVDTDKHSDDRVSPMPNTHDVVPNPMAKATQGNNYAVNQKPGSYINVTNQQILTYDGFNTRVQITPTQMKVSQAGIDVTTATNAQLLFNSAQDIFKIVAKMPVSIPSFTIGAGGTNVSLLTVAHGQPVTPIANVYVSGVMVGGVSGTLIASSYIPIPVYSTSLGDPLFPNTAVSPSYYGLHVNFAVDATNVYLQATYTGSTVDTIKAIPATIFLLQETAT